MNNLITYGIRAENRKTKERVMITSPMTLKEAENWKPRPQHKKAYKYFRVCRYSGKSEI